MSHLKYPSDVASVDAVVEALYEYISFSPGTGPDWERMRSLYLPQASSGIWKAMTGRYLKNY